MALFVMLYDRDVDRRTATIRAIQRERLPNEINLRHHVWSDGPWHMICRAAPSTPIAMYEDPDRWAMHVGKLLNRSLSVMTPDRSVTDPVGGFGLAVELDRRRNVISATTDFMGVFPLYVVQGNDWMMITSSPWFATCHPSFAPEWDLEGVASVLLTMHLVSGQTVWKGVRRLASCHRLEWRPGGTVVTRPCYRLQLGDRSGQPDPEAVYARLSALLEAWRDPAAPASVLLSGGLDSRLIAAILHRNTGGQLTAFTNGIDTDIEVQCARLVADRLGIAHTVEEVTGEQGLTAFIQAARFELASNGMNTTEANGLTHRMAAGCSLANGNSLDLFMNNIAFYQSKMQTADEDGLLAYHGRWGMSDEACALLRHGSDWIDAIRATRAHQRQIIAGYEAPSIFHAAQLYEGFFRQRHHVGGIGWRQTWHVWPVTVAYDATLIEMLLGTDDRAREDRRLEKLLLEKKFPALARLPFDRNSANTEPLLKRRRLDDVMDRLAGRPRARVQAFTSHQQLRYFRTMDIHAPAWIRVREALEPLRDNLHDLFDAKALEAVLPKPDQIIPMNIPIAESSCRKTLLGLMVIADAMRQKPMQRER
jgi:asparagine synthase (glutamine-hydrolysing)